jgi:hypothetical protein
MAALSNFIENHLIDFLLRAQSLGITGATAAAGTGPATTYIALFTAAPTAAGGGTEVVSTGTNYSRVPITSALTAWAGTQGAGTTVASSGTSGQTSNNTVVTFANPSASWGTITSVGIFDAATGGDLLMFGNLTSPQAVSPTNPAIFPAGSLVLSLS